jgi:hypothetical protein
MSELALSKSSTRMPSVKTLSSTASCPKGRCPHHCVVAKYSFTKSRIQNSSVAVMLLTRSRSDDVPMPRFYCLRVCKGIILGCCNSRMTYCRSSVPGRAPPPPRPFRLYLTVINWPADKKRTRLAAQTLRRRHASPDAATRIILTLTGRSSSYGLVRANGRAPAGSVERGCASRHGSLRPNRSRHTSLARGQPSGRSRQASPGSSFRLYRAPVHGELLIRQRSVCEKGHDSVLARRTAVAGRFGAQHGLAVRPEFSP